MTEDRNIEDEANSGLTPEGTVQRDIDMDQARFLAMRTASEPSAAYGRRFRKVPMVLEIVGAAERTGDYLVTLSFRPQGQFGGAPGLQEVSIGKEGDVAGRRVVRLPEGTVKRRVPVALIGIGLVVAAVVVAAGVFAAVRAGGDGPSTSEALAAGAVLPAAPTAASPTTAPVFAPSAISPAVEATATPVAPAAPSPLPTATQIPVSTATIVPASPLAAMELPAPGRIEVIIDPSQVTLEAGSSLTFNVKAIDGAGQQLSDPKRSWRASPQVGVISEDGVFAAGTKAGAFDAAVQVDVSHDAGTGSATADVIIEPGPLENIELQPASIAATPGESVQLTAIAYDRFKNVIEEVELSWEAEAGLTVDQSGKVTVKPKGSAVPSGLVAWWPGDGDGKDVVGDNNGVLNGGVGFAPGVSGQGFRLDGQNDYISVTPDTSLNLRGDVTLQLWAKRTEFGRQQVMVVKGAGVVRSVDVPTAFVLRFSGERLSESGDFLEAGFERANGSDVFLRGPIVADEKFHHYAYVRSGGEHKLFLDGMVVVRDSFIGGPGDTSGIPLVIGSGPSINRINMFGGLIDEVQVFARALSDKEIRDVYQGGSFGGGVKKITVRASYKGSELTAVATIEVE